MLNIMRYIAIISFLGYSATVLSDPIQSIGSGSAVYRLDRQATFDAVDDGVSLVGYTEDSILIPGSPSAFNTPRFGMAGGHHYSGGQPYTSITTSDGVKFTALEFNSTDFGEDAFVLGENAAVMNLYYEIVRAGVITGSGTLMEIPGSVIGFFDEQGFDEVRVAAYFYKSDATSFDPPKLQSFNRISIDNVRASVSGDSDEDGNLDDFDNCPDLPNQNQSDVDNDSIGDVCDPYPNGGSALLQCQNDLNECLSNPLGRDEDSDGEVDARDACPNTLFGAEVDESGCSQSQFCSLFVQANTCVRADWRNDDIISNSKDCIWNNGENIAVPACVKKQVGNIVQ